MSPCGPTRRAAGAKLLLVGLLWGVEVLRRCAENGPCWLAGVPARMEMLGLALKGQSTGDGGLGLQGG